MRFSSYYFSSKNARWKVPTGYIQNLCEFADFAFAPAFLKCMWTGIRFLFCEMFSRDSVFSSGEKVHSIKMNLTLPLDT